MQFRARRAISPIIATLLLIAIAVAAGIIVYVFTSSLTGNLTQGGGQQVSDQMSMDAYSFGTTTAPSFVLRDVGGSSWTVLSLYFNGNLCQGAVAACQAPVYTTGASPLCQSGPVCTPGEYVSVTLTVTAPTTGSSNLVRVVTSDGGTFTFTLIAGRSG